MRQVRYPVELQDRDLAVACLAYGRNKVLDLPIGSRIAGRRDQQRVVTARFVCEATTFSITILRRTATPRENDSMPTKPGQGLLIKSVARPSSS